MFNAFITYSHLADDKFAPVLQNALQKFAKPWYKKRNLEIFLDESSLSVAPHLFENIKKAIDQSEYLILLASPQAEKSEWVNREVEYWLKHKPLDNILIVLTEGEIKWDRNIGGFQDPVNNSLPPALDTAFKDSPFYIDMRQSKTEEDLSLDNPIFKKEVLKLAAKLHNKIPNDLASEEVKVHRRMMLLRNGGLSLLSILLAASVLLGLYANKQRKEAVNQTEIAEASLEELKEFVNKGIGKEFEGGIIFSVDAERKNGYVAAKKDLEGLYNWKEAKEACEKFSVTVDDTVYNDWFLPTKDILEDLYTKKEEVGNFRDPSDWSNEFYWSSSLVEEEKNAWVTFMRMTKIRTSTYNINNRRGYVRPVRKFTSSD